MSEKLSTIYKQFLVMSFTLNPETKQIFLINHIFVAGLEPHKDLK